MVVGLSVREGKLGCVTRELWIHEHLLDWCIVCLGLVNRLWCHCEHGMAWHGVVWCGVALLICVTKHYVDMKIMSIRIQAWEGDSPMGVLS